MTNVDRLKAQSDAIEQREEAARIEAAFKGWSPTAANVNALPEPLRGYIHQLETVCDPAGDQQSIVILRDTVRSLRQLIVEHEGELKARVPGELTAVGSRHVSYLLPIIYRMAERVGFGLSDVL